jgi:hypothetical protein
VTECAGTVLEFLFQKDTSQNGVPEPFLPGIDVTNIFPSPIEFWVTLRVPKLIFFIKVALPVRN